MYHIQMLKLFEVFIHTHMYNILHAVAEATFTRGEDWGFLDFATRDKLGIPTSGFVHNWTLDIKLEIEVRKRTWNCSFSHYLSYAMELILNCFSRLEARISTLVYTDNTCTELFDDIHVDIVLHTLFALLQPCTWTMWCTPSLVSPISTIILPNQ